MILPKPARANPKNQVENIKALHLHQALWREAVMKIPAAAVEPEAAEATEATE